MFYVLIENNELRGILDYKPNTGKDNVRVVEYDGIISKENILVIDGEIVDKDDYTFINGKYIKRDYELEKQQTINKQARKYLKDTDWLVLRHRDQIALSLDTSLTDVEYKDLLRKRQEARSKVIDYTE